MQDLKHPKGPKFAPNISICNGFRDNQHFQFPEKLKMAAGIQKIEKINLKMF